jgi:hypothetical protein
MAKRSAQRMTNPEVASVERLLALEIRSWKFGYAVLEGTKLVDWGVCRFPAGAVAAAIRRLAFLLKTYAPTVVIARRTRRAKHRSSQSAVHLIRRIRLELERRSTRFVVLSRGDVRKFFAHGGHLTKAEISTVVADRFDHLKSRLPRSRKPWDPERHVVVVFDAVATAIAFDGLGEPTPDT